ncbi:MAG TPA: hypothetical protein VF135_06055 [Terriglobales bacterium]
MNRSVLVAVLFLVLAGSYCAATTACTNQLPKPVSEAIQKKWQGWQIVDVADLRADDQTLWRKTHGTACPGVAVGHFEGSSTSYAVTLFRHKNGLEQVLLVIKPEAHGDSRVYVLSKPQNVAYLSVIHKLSPGTYDDGEGGKVRIRRDAIAYEAIEAGNISYYFEGGKFRSLQTSE